MSDLWLQHLTPDETERWAQGLLPAARELHLAQCGECRAVADRERKLYRELAQLPRFVPGSGEWGGVRVGDRVTQLREGRADRELRRRRREHVARVERRRGARRNRQRHEVRVAREAGQETVVGGDKEMAGGAGGEGAPRGPYAGMHQ